MLRPSTTGHHSRKNMNCENEQNASCPSLAAACDSTAAGIGTVTEMMTEVKVTGENSKKRLLRNQFYQYRSPFLLQRRMIYRRLRHGQHHLKVIPQIRCRCRPRESRSASAAYMTIQCRRHTSTSVLRRRQTAQLFGAWKRTRLRMKRTGTTFRPTRKRRSCGC